MKRFSYTLNEDGRISLVMDRQTMVVDHVSSEVPTETHHDSALRKIEIRGRAKKLELVDFGELGMAAYLT